MEYRRDISKEIEERLLEQRSFIQIVLGPRQTGKTTAVKQAIKASRVPAHVAAADFAEKLTANWLEVEWLQARKLAAKGQAVLFVDEIQKVQGDCLVVLQAPSPQRIPQQGESPSLEDTSEGFLSAGVPAVATHSLSRAHVVRRIQGSIFATSQ